MTHHQLFPPATSEATIMNWESLTLNPSPIFTNYHYHMIKLAPPVTLIYNRSFMMDLKSTAETIPSISIPSNTEAWLTTVSM